MAGMAPGLKKALLRLAYSAFRGLAHARETCDTNVAFVEQHPHAYANINSWLNCCAAATQFAVVTSFGVVVSVEWNSWLRRAWQTHIRTKSQKIQ